MADRIVQLKDQNDNKVYPVIAGTIYPVGSIYMSVNNVNPATIFGGTWQQIKDTFLLACGDTYANGTTGGEATVKLDLSNYWYSVWNAGNPMPTTDVNSAFNSGNQLGIQIKYSDNINVPHNNMPPYLAVYVWVRTA